ncbi:Protein RMD5-like A, partial [Mucuna pruriens]
MSSAGGNSQDKDLRRMIGSARKQDEKSLLHHSKLGPPSCRIVGTLFPSFFRGLSDEIFHFEVCELAKHNKLEIFVPLKYQLSLGVSDLSIKMELSSIKDAFDRVAKKQKLSSSKSQEVVDQVGHEIEQALATIQSPHDPSSPVDQKSVLTELKFKLNAIGPLQQLEGSNKELNMSLTKYQKLLEKLLNPDISKAYRNVDFDTHIVNQIIANHLYRQGLFDLGDSIINEAGEPDATALRSQFLEMHQIIGAMRDRNLQPALTWVSANQEKLVQIGSNLELKIHTLQFVEVLQNGTRADALKYARTYLAPFASLNKDEFQKLMGCLLYAGRLESSPYSELMSPIHWEMTTEELARQFCTLLGQSYENPLSVAVAAGVEGLPTLLKLANVMAAKKQEWQEMKQLPVPVELGKEFQFHSIFVCPVSRDQGSEENPPMLLPCLHVLCKQSIMKLSKNSTRTFKCPYCPAEATVAHCRQLCFHDLTAINLYDMMAYSHLDSCHCLDIFRSVMFLRMESFKALVNGNRFRDIPSVRQSSSGLRLYRPLLTKNCSAVNEFRSICLYHFAG